ncbi:haloacid dehalogenase [Tenacibaculum sp. SG-28]|nr:haloacid dehalogenase [Tenacibaculum sp. SG-28]
MVIFTSCNQVTSNPDAVTEIKQDPLPSWNDSDAKEAILSYVSDVTNENSQNFIPINMRISTFDNDGTLWSEQPAYFQLFFAMDRVRELAKLHPEWQSKQPFKAVIDNDLAALKKQGLTGLAQLMMASHTGTTIEEFDTIVKDWIKTAKHPIKNVGFDQLVYQPMLELLEYLRANHFKTYIVSGGGLDFMRAIVTEIYGIPEEQILGSRIKTNFEYNEGNPKIVRIPELEFNDDKEGKPLNIQKIIGKKPVFAAGNSDGDLQMLQWTASNKYKSFKLYIHHTDSIREWAYDRNSAIGKLDKGLDAAKAKGWSVIDMKTDWKVVYPSEISK